MLEQVAKAPRSFDVQARNPANTVHIGDDAMAFGAVYGPPFVREGEVRRDATMDDFRNFTRLSQSFSVIDSAGGIICEPEDTPLDSRHLDMTYALQTLTDKIYMGNVVSGRERRRTPCAMTEILFGGRETIERTPATISLINCNSPLRWDERMLEAQFAYCEANQAVVITPFLLMGAMSPVSIPADAHPADRRGAHRDRAVPAHPPGLPGDLRVVPLQHRHAVGVALLRHARVGDRACCAPGRSPATSGSRSAPAAGSRRARPPTRRRATRA